MYSRFFFAPKLSTFPPLSYSFFDMPPGSSLLISFLNRRIGLSIFLIITFRILSLNLVVELLQNLFPKFPSAECLASSVMTKTGSYCNQTVAATVWILENRN